jgi:hypothetical protein
MYARGINNGGQVARFAFDSAGAEHGFAACAVVATFDHLLATPGPRRRDQRPGTVIGWYDAPTGRSSFRLARPVRTDPAAWQPLHLRAQHQQQRCDRARTSTA